MYEDYLNKLVKIPALKSSELLSTFLSSIEDFEEEETGFSKLFRKSVVPTLRKERGQNLDAFITSFVSSCKATSVTPPRSAHTSQVVDYTLSFNFIGNTNGKT